MYKRGMVTRVMPVYNEEKTVETIVRRVLAQKFVDEIIAVDDGLKDPSLEKLRKLQSKNNKIKLLMNKVNRRKGATIIKGIAHVKDGIIIIQDADLEYFTEDHPKLLKASESRRYNSRTFEEGKKINFIYGIKETLYILVNAFRHS